METAYQLSKRNTLCRYFIRYGDCFHGDMCQYVHAYPPQVEQQNQIESPQPTRQVPLSHPTPQTPQQQLQQHHQHHQYQQQQQQSQLQQPQLQQPPPQLQPQLQPQNQGYNMSKLICSLKSDLPNEIDFAMQVATLLANTDNFTWFKDYPLIDAICSSLHVFVCVCDDLSNCYCYPRFWKKILTKNSDNKSLQDATTPLDMEPSYLNFDKLKNHTYEDHKKIYRRIKTAAELLKQFSMTIGVPKSENELQQQQQNSSQFNYHQIKKKKLKASPSLLKFVSLLVHCDDAALNLIGLDILSSTASKLSKIPDIIDDSTCSKLVQMFQEYCVDCIGKPDGDIYIVNRSIEVVSRLISSSNRRISSSIISQITEKNLIFRLEQFLTSHYDVTLFLSALEFCYRISRHQSHLLTAGRTRYLIKILVNLLNCDDSRYFTPNALKKIKLVDEEELTVHYLHPAPSNQNNVQPSSRQVQQPTTNHVANHTTNHVANHTTNHLLNHNTNHISNSVTTHTTNDITNQNKGDSLNKVSNHHDTMRATNVVVNHSTTNDATSVATKDTKNDVKNNTNAVRNNINDIKNNTNDFKNNTNDTTVSKTINETTISTTTIINNTTNTINTSSNANIPAQTITTTPTTNPAPLPTKEYRCEWSDCNAKFEQAKRVYTHVFEAHIGPIAPDALSTCLWSSPNGSGPGCLTKRPKYSLLTHLNDFHCNPTALERALNRSQPIKPPEHPGYAPNAALLAIKRHANSHIEGTNGVENNHHQSPLSISVRLTAALILRNLATESPEIKQALENHEPLLSEICMSNGRDEAKIIAECLSLFSNE